MNALTKIALVTATAAALTGGAAAAQPYGGYDHRNVAHREAAIDGRIEAGVRSGRLTRQEAWRLRAEFRDIQRRADMYAANGMSGWERADIDRRFDRLSVKIRAEAHDYDRYGYGYGDRDRGDWRR